MKAATPCFTLVAAAHLRSKLYWQAVLTDRFGRSRRTSKARTMFTAPRRRFNQRLCAMHASLQGISLGHADILLQSFMKDLEQNTSFGSNNGAVTSEWAPARRAALLSIAPVEVPRSRGPYPASPRRPSRLERGSRSREDSSSRDTHQSAVGKCRMVNSI